ncbi:MAG: diacylglycerol kinase family lipid kinase [Rubrobacter sp.]|nr:diacylglycerol kinase family lipid kinase [Rubrobacter sp.]
MKARRGTTLESSKTKARVICNPASGGGDYEPDDVRKELGGFDIEWIATEKSGDAAEAARQWTDGLLIVIGGDGTVNEAVNGLGKAGFPDGVTLAILPTGTSNDLAATLAIPEDPDAAEDAIRRNRVRTLDAAKATSDGVGEMFFINAATGGFGAETADIADGEMKSRWGKLAYVRASLEVARDFDAPEVEFTLDGEARCMKAVNVAVGNCRYVGGGWPAAPRANPEDGLLDLVVVEDAGLGGILALAPPMLAESDYMDKEGVFHARAKRIRVETSPGGLSFNADGELVGDEPVEFEVIPGALKVIVGEGYVAEPEA